METEKLAQFIFEAGHLRRISHEGWKLTGVEQPDSVAEHSLRAAQIAYILAHMEGYAHPEQVCAMLVFHDIGEARVGDIHKLANRYIDVDEAGAVNEQTAELGDIGHGIRDLWSQVEERDSQAGIIAKDADYLEQAAAACEYAALGHYAVQAWIDNIRAALKTASARMLLEALVVTDPFTWWNGLKKL